MNIIYIIDIHEYIIYNLYLNTDISKVKTAIE